MKYIELPEGSVRRLSFYLAMEEYVARCVSGDDDCFFMWQVRPTVIFGRNQLIENEVNLPYCRSHGIETYRRKSGGGCVYADMSNVMMSYITRADNVALTYNKYINMVVLALRRLGIPAASTGRNDVVIGDRKVSGNAFYHMAGHSIVHGTMLYDTNMENMVGAITPDSEKLRSKGVESVRQHITFLKDHTTLTLDQWKDHTRQMLCGDNAYQLTEQDVAAIEEIERGYLSPDFIYGNNPRYTLIRRGRIEGVGTLEARIEMKNEEVKAINLVGDYLLVGDLDTLLNSLHGAQLTAESLTAVLPERLDAIVLGLKRDDFINLLIHSQNTI